MPPPGATPAVAEVVEPPAAEVVSAIPPPSPPRPGPSIQCYWNTSWPSTEVAGGVPVCLHKMVEVE